MKTWACGRCGHRIFFENVSCGSCGAALGFVPSENVFASFDIDDSGTWQRVGPAGPAQRPCANYNQEQVCNWMVSADDPSPLCLSCKTTHIIPALGQAENRTRWLLLEQAKRRLVYSLASLKLPSPSKTEDPEHGLSFQFLEELTPKEKVLTGHDEGVITLNIAEADDARREQMRAHLHEPYRTLLGHFRHEIGHYYWDRLILDSLWIDEYRRLFGDERADYAEALKKHYATPLLDWQDRFISSYASSHPWEDWAESWAHYMHMQDGLETASSWGLRLSHAMPGASAVEPRPLDAIAGSLGGQLIEQWLPVSQFINAMDRSLGSRDSYPFVLPTPVIEKLEFIHKVVSAAGRREVPMRFTPLTVQAAPASTMPATTPVASSEASAPPPVLSAPVSAPLSAPVSNEAAMSP